MQSRTRQIAEKKELKGMERTDGDEGREGQGEKKTSVTFLRPARWGPKRV